MQPASMLGNYSQASTNYCILVQSVVNGSIGTTVVVIAAVRRVVYTYCGHHPLITQCLCVPNQHMADALLSLDGTTVAVVGMAHLDGIERLWETAQVSQ